MPVVTASSRKVDEYGRSDTPKPAGKLKQDYERICNNSNFAKMFRAINVTTLVDKICSKEEPWIGVHWF